MGLSLRLLKGDLMTTESTWRLSGIYRIFNSTAGKCYVGSAVNISSRWSLHRNQLANGSHHSKKLQRAWNKYGADTFVFEVLEVVTDTALLVSREQFWIDQLQAVDLGYNVKPVAGSSLGFKYSEESRAKMSQIQIGRPRSLASRANQSASTRGKPKSEAHKAKLAEVNKARGAAKQKTFAECLCCSKQFKTFPSELARGGGKYCSKSCYRLYAFGVEHDVRFKAWEGEQ